MRALLSVDKILVYAVLHYLPDMAAAEEFVGATIEKVATGGKLLLGDLPNKDCKARFLSTPEGQEFDRVYREANRDSAEGMAFNEAMKVFDEAEGIKSLDDSSVLRLLALARTMGCDAFMLPQHPNLPFGRTREDILIVKP